MDNSTLPFDFDPWTQEFSFVDGRSGEILIRAMQDLDQYRLYGFRLAINYACQVGASFMLLLVLLLLTKADKRKSYIFILNSGCLLLNTIRCVMLCTFVTSGFYNPYSQLSGDFRQLTHSDYATQVVQRVFTALVTIMILISLCSQVWIVCVTTPPLRRNIIMGVTTTLGCVALGYRLALIYFNTKTTLKLESMEPYNGLASTCYVLQAVSIWLFSCVFIYKLGYAMLKRRRLNMPQFGPMQVVFIMGCQTMLVPAIFTTLQFADSEAPELITNVQTMVCIFLPLSAIWAGVANEANIAYNGPDSHQRLIRGEFYRDSNSTLNSQGSTAFDKSRQMSMATYAKGKDIESAITTPTSPSYEKSISGNGIRVDHDFGVSHDDAADRV